MPLAILGGTPVTNEPFPVWPSFSEQAYGAALEPLRSGKVNYWTGTLGRRFEQAFAQYLGAAHAISTTNGTSALHTALAALGIGAGDEVICPCYTFIATAFAVLQAGALPVFADVDGSHTLDPSQIEAHITERTRAVVVVHTFGVAADMDAILAVARRHRLAVIEDCAQAIGGEYRGKRLGTLGDAGCFSFCQSKHFTTGGEGGAVAVKDERVAWTCRSFRDHGYDVEQRLALLELESRLNYIHPTVGFNYRMTEMQSAIGLAELARFGEWNLPTRRRNGAYLKEKLMKHPLVLEGPMDTSERLNAYWWAAFVIDADKLCVPVKAVLEAIEREGVPVSGTPWPEIYREKAFTDRRGFGTRNYPFEDPAARRIDYDASYCKTARYLGERTVAFPVHPVYTLKHMDRCIEAFDKVVSHYGR